MFEHDLGLSVILGNGCGIKGQNYVSLPQGSKKTEGFYCRN